MSRDDDTIFALSSGAGRSAVAVVRLSGPRSGEAVERLCRGKPKARRFSRRRLYDPSSGDVIDEAVVIWLPGPGTATGEDMCEFHVHGSEAVLRGLSEALRGSVGVCAAEAGEFTRRAFLNGRVDLVEVEGLAEVLAARTEGQRKIAMRQFLGSSSSVVEEWRAEIVGVLASLDAILEFSEEQDVAERWSGEWRERLGNLIAAMESALELGKRASAVSGGVRVVLAGHPNVGKSSLLNRLAQREAAIVTAKPGTTRDIIEVQVDLAGWPVTLIDTAGLRNEVADEIESEGIARAKGAAAVADLVVWVWSADIAGSELVPAEVRADVKVRSKSDLGSAPAERDGLAISAKSGEGIPMLVEWLTEYVRGFSSGVEAAVVLEGRQSDALSDSIRLLNDAMAADDSQPELIVADLRGAADALGRITGRIDVEEWMSEIFSRFCVGK